MPIQYIEMDLRNKTTSEFRAVLTVPWVSLIPRFHCNPVYQVNSSSMYMQDYREHSGFCVGEGGYVRAFFGTNYLKYHMQNTSAGVSVALTPRPLAVTAVAYETSGTYIVRISVR